MEEKMDFETISNLINKQILGCITDSEKEQLDEWCASDLANDELYRKLINETYLSEQYEKWKAVETNIPEQEMRNKVSARKPDFHILLRIASAAAAVFVILITTISILLFRSEKKYDELRAKYQNEQYLVNIQHGRTRAIFSTNDGQKIILGENDSQNEKILKQYQQQGESVVNSLEIPRGGEFRITLEDGTEVCLNVESSLRYPARFSKKSREVEIVGEAYFKVAKDDRPFRVKTYGQIINVYGTEFNVQSYNEDKYIYTTLVNGSISLSSEMDGTEELILKPGQQSVLAKEDGAVIVREVEASKVTSWKDGMFVFENQTLGQIMKQLSRWYNFSYVFLDTKIEKTVFMGRIPRYSRFGDVTEILEKSGNLRFDVKDDTIIISKKNN